MRIIATCAFALIGGGCGQLFGIEHIPLAGSDAVVADIGRDVPVGMFQLDVTTLGDLGTVSIDDGRNAPTTCNEMSPTKCISQYPAGTTVTLTATAAPMTSVFVLWDNACLYQNVNDTGGRPTCILAPTSGELLVTARFAPSSQAWLALIPDQGSVDDAASEINCNTCDPDLTCTAGGVCVGFLINGATTTLTATADPGCTAFGTFRSGSAGCVPGAPSCTFTPTPAPSAAVVNYDFVTNGSNCSQ